jgi:predicted RNA methylase
VSAARSEASGKARSYERSTPPDLRTQRGLFYTPDEVADLVASRALELWSATHPGASLEGRCIVDPSCGAGALLAAAARVLGPVNARLVGGDIDAAAVSLARERLGHRADIQIGDALTNGPSGDVVLTNPPYGRDPTSADLDRFVTFWRAAVRRVAPGGVLAVLAPRSWTTGVRYAKARREVIGPSGVRSVVELARGSFPDAYVDTCVALCIPALGARAGREPTRALPAVLARRGAGGAESLGSLFLSRRGILAPPARGDGTPLLLGPVVPFVWPRQRSAFARVRPRDVVEGKAALALDRGPRLLIRRIVGRASRLTCVVTSALLHSRPVTERLAAYETSATKDDFAQVTLARLRELPVPRLATTTRRNLARVRRLRDTEVDAQNPADSAAWLELWARQAEALGAALSRERTRLVDADPRWNALRARLDAFVIRMNG